MPETTLPLCVRIDADDAFSRHCLKKDGWREIEVLEVWQHNGPPNAVSLPDYTIDLATPTDAEACCWIASTSFTHDRLHSDPQVDNATADREKIRRVMQGFDSAVEQVFVARNKDVHGFVIVSNDGQYIVIELIAVDRRQRRKNIALALLAHVASINHQTSIIAGTQATNLPSKKLYTAAGFQPVQRHRTFHK